MNAPLKIWLFGPMRTLVDGELMPRMRSRKGQWLLALLVLRGGGPVGRGWIAGQLWPDSDPNVALTNLRSVVSDLRRGLGSQADRLLTPDRKTLLLNLQGAEVDLAAFDAAVRQGQWAQAVDHYIGPLLEDCDEEWIVRDRASRERSCLDALRNLAEMDPGQAVRFSRRAVEIAPWQDGPRRDLMLALARTGDINAALAVYRDFAQALRGETGGSPDLQTTDLYVRLRSGDPTPASSEHSSHRGALPNAITSFIGREDERFELIQELKIHRMVTLTGMGGVGKTRLAGEVAHLLAPQFQDGVWLIPLETVLDESGLNRSLTVTLRLRDKPGRTPLEAIVEEIGTKHLLLVLDNCEQILVPCAQLSERLLTSGKGITILATSREPLGLVGEKVWAVPGLTVPDPDHLPQQPATLLRVLAGYEAVRLFVERAEAATPTFRLTAENARAVAELCALLEGSPLALELAACRTRTMSVPEMLSRLREHRLDLLTGQRHTGVTRHQTLRAALDWSYTLLTADERRLFVRLSVFSGGWTLDAAESVAGATAPLLESLVSKSLVTFDVDGRYGFLESVRQYASEKPNSDERQTEHLHWYTALAERLEAERAATEQFEIEMGNFRVAMNSADLEPELGLRLAGALGIHWRIVRADEEGRQSLRKALDRPGAERLTLARAKALQYFGLVTFHRNLAQASAAFREAYEVAVAVGDRARTASILRELGLSAFFEGDNDAAETYYAEGLSLARSVGDRHLVAVILGGWSLIWLARGDYGRARQLSEESLSLFRKIGQPRHVAWALRSAGSISHDLGDYPAMRSFNEEALALFRENHLEEGVAWCLDDLGKAATETGQYALGEELLERSLRLMRGLGDAISIASALNSLGENALARGDLARARSLQEESLSNFRSNGHRLGVARALDGLGDVLIGSGDPEAFSHYQEAFAIWLAVGDRKRIRDGILRRCDRFTPERSIPLRARATRLGLSMGLPIPPLLAARNEAALSMASHSSQFDRAWSSGWEMSLEEAIQQVQEE